jgi:hypothetical protein
MQQSLILELGVAAYALTVEARKERGRAGSVKAFVVVKNLDDQWFPFKKLASHGVRLLRRNEWKESP